MLYRTFGQCPWTCCILTGYTSQAGYCLVATGEKDGIRLIAVVLQTRSVAEREQKALQLLEFGFNTFERFQPDVNEALHESIFVANAQDPYVKLVAAEPISLLISKAYKDKVTYEISLVSPLEAPIAQDERVGELKYMVGDQVIASTPLLSSRDVPKASGVTLLYRRLKQWVHTNPIVSKLDDWLL